MGVGACVWDGALVLAGYLAAQPRYAYVGCRAVELGAGVGLVGLALAKMGAQVLGRGRRTARCRRCARGPPASCLWRVAVRLRRARARRW